MGIPKEHIVLGNAARDVSKVLCAIANPLNEAILQRAAEKYLVNAKLGEYL